MKQNGGQLANLQTFGPTFKHSGEPSNILANLQTSWRTFIQTVPANHVARMLVKPMGNEAKWRSAGPKWSELEFEWTPHGSHLDPAMWASFQNEARRVGSFQNCGPPF